MTLTQKLRTIASNRPEIAPILIEAANEIDRVRASANDFRQECKLLEIELQGLRRKIRDGKTALVSESTLPGQGQLGVSNVATSSCSWLESDKDRESNGSG